MWLITLWLCGTTARRDCVWTKTLARICKHIEDVFEPNNSRDISHDVISRDYSSLTLERAHFIWKLSIISPHGGRQSEALVVVEFDRWKSKYEFSMNTFDDKIVWWLILSINNLALIVSLSNQRLLVANWFTLLQFSSSSSSGASVNCSKFYASFFPLQQCNGAHWLAVNGKLSFRIQCNLSEQNRDCTGNCTEVFCWTLAQPWDTLCALWPCSLKMQITCVCVRSQCAIKPSEVKTKKTSNLPTCCITERELKANDSITVPARDHITVAQCELSTWKVRKLRQEEKEEEKDTEFFSGRLRMDIIKESH